jgi:predicted short-subunit dehydrogenase-like oxidoreductase (DUF2520 family)
VNEPRISIVGLGRLGNALARQLHDAGYTVCEVIAHNRVSPQARRLADLLGASATTLHAAKLAGNLVWFCVPDSGIAATAAQLAFHDWQGKIAFHSSAVLGSDSLVRLKEGGARVASVHPLMTFVRGSVPNLSHVPFAIEGDRVAVRAARLVAGRLGGRPVTIRKQDKAAYHLFATLICPLLVSLLAVSEKAATRAGVSPAEARIRMLPILRQTISNYGLVGVDRAFTGPFVRGDVETVRLHLKTLARSSAAVKAVYVSLAEAALENLPHRRRNEIRSVLRQSLQN